MHPINLIRDAVSSLRGNGQLKHETNVPPVQVPLNPHIFHDAVWGGDEPLDSKDPQRFNYPVAKKRASA